MKRSVFFVNVLGCLLIQTYAFGSVGREVPCTEKLSAQKTHSPESFIDSCRAGQNTDVTLFNSKNGVLWTDTGKALVEKRFDLRLAESLIGLGYNTDVIQKAFFNPETSQWVVYDPTQVGLQQVYLVPDGFKDHDTIITLSVPANTTSELINLIELKAGNIEVQPTNGKIISLKNRVPNLDEIKRMGYEFFDVAHDWTFLSNGVKNFPIYDRVKLLVEKCDGVLREKAKARCFKSAEADLGRELLDSTLKNDPKNVDLIEYLKKPSSAVFIINDFIREYRELISSSVLNPNYDWSKNILEVKGCDGESCGTDFFYQYTYDLVRRSVTYSAGMAWWKPGAYNIRDVYYPVGAI